MDQSLDPNQLNAVEGRHKSVPASINELKQHGTKIPSQLCQRRIKRLLHVTVGKLALQATKYLGFSYVSGYAIFLFHITVTCKLFSALTSVSVTLLGNYQACARADQGLSDNLSSPTQN